MSPLEEGKGDYVLDCTGCKLAEQAKNTPNSYASMQDRVFEISEQL